MQPHSNEQLARVERVLSYIHGNLQEPLTVASLAARSRWSRWQLQRTFASATGFSVASYVRRLRLGRAAELLLCTDQRQLDIALSCGFDNEISFNRCFRQVFGCAPGVYRRRGQRSNLLVSTNPARLRPPPGPLAKGSFHIRIETLPSFWVAGVSDTVCGLDSPHPDFATRVPAIWRRLDQHLLGRSLSHGGVQLGVLVVADASAPEYSFPYWAALPADSVPEHAALPFLQVPAQTYAVLPHFGPIEGLAALLQWFIDCWLPQAGYRGLSGHDLERYDARYVPGSANSYMEYWVPIESAADAPNG